MKKSILLFCLVSFLNLNSQIDSTKTVAIAINTNYPIATGKSFLNKGYKATNGYGLEIQGNLKKYFLGIGVRTNNYEIKEISIIGDFNKVSARSLYTFGGYRFFITNKKIYLENRLGFGVVNILHISNLSQYSLSGKTIFIGSKINYNFNSDINFFICIEASKTWYNIDLEGPYNRFYKSANQFIPSIGVKLLLGRNTK